MKKEKKNVAVMLENTDKKMKFECTFCKEDLPHMLVILSKDGDIHVHAPFNNKYLISQFIEAIVEEQKKYD